ncbi:MAG: hypothetical protein JO257_19275 [Deltaproteobacteria bacterium]|nr:hypothetical protein [Deltaproteobacteria bacterium]
MRWFVVVALAACSQSRSPVRGSFAYRYGDGTVVPIDMSQQRFQVYVEDADGFSVYPGAPVAGRADGTFEIADVPEGPYLLRRSWGDYFGVFTQADDHAVDERWDVLGRPGAEPASSSTRLQLDVAGLAQWQPADRLILDCFGNATELYAPLVTPGLAPDATAIHGTVPWGTAYSWGPAGVPYLMDAGVDDMLYLTRQSTAINGHVTTRTLTQMLAAPAPTQAADSTTSITGALDDVPATDRIAVTVRGDALASLVPSGTRPTSLAASIVLGPATDRGMMLGPELASMSSTMPTLPARAVLHYGRPFDASWVPAIGAWYTAIRDVQLENGRTIAEPFDAFSETRPLDGDTYTFGPLLAVDHVTIDEQPIEAGGITVPHQQALRLAFTGPTDFTAGRVIVWTTTRKQAAQVVFDHLPVDLPPDIFEDGEHYALQIDVFVDEGRGHTRKSGTYTDAFSLHAQ